MFCFPFLFLLYEDPECLAEIAQWAVPVSNISDQIVGTSSVYLDGAYDNCCARECNFGNLITDAYLRDFVNPADQVNNGWSNVSVAVEVCGYIRTSLFQGTEHFLCSCFHYYPLYRFSLEINKIASNNGKL